MIRSQWLSFGCIVLATLGAALGFTLGHLELVAPVIVIFGAFWLVANQRGWRWVNPLALLVFVASCGYAVLKGMVPGLMLGVLVAALSAWDLESLIRRLDQVKPEAVDPGIEPRHLLRLAAIDGASFALGGAAMLLRVKVSLGLLLALGLVVAFGLGQLVLYMRRSS